MGRPPGAPNGGMRRRHPQHRELRDPRFEELDSEEEDGQGVILDPRAQGFVSDELYFDGYDVGQGRPSRRALYDQAHYDEGFDSDEMEYRDQRMIAYHASVEKEEALIQTALERIARARSKGKTNVNLSQEEMEALERRRGQQPEPPAPLASPPATPAKPAAKGKVGSRSNSSTNLASQKTRTKRGSTGLFGGSSSPAKSNSKAKVNRKPSAEQAIPYPTGQGPPGIMVPGPNGRPVYAPIEYYGPPSPELVRAQSGGSRPNSKPGSRSASKHRRRESTPPDRAEAYAQYPPRYYPPPPGMRPESSGSNRSLPDDIDWYPPPPRNRSASNAQYIGYPGDYDTAPPMPAAQGRRNITGPPDVRYSSLRRVPPSSPLAHRPSPAHASHSDPSVTRRQGSGLSQEVDGSSSSSSSSSEDQGVQVEIVPEGGSGNGYTINRSLAQEPPPVSGNEGRKRRSGRR